MNSTNRKQRQNYLVNPSFQWAMVRWTIFISLLISGIFYISNLIFFKHLYEMGSKQNLQADSAYYQFLIQESSRMNLIFAMTLFATLIVIVTYGIRFSHKVAGPLYRFSKYLRENDPSQPIPDLKFRDGDFFIELSQDFNQFKAKIPSQSQG